MFMMNNVHSVLELKLRLGSVGFVLRCGISNAINYFSSF